MRARPEVKVATPAAGTLPAAKPLRVLKQLLGRGYFPKELPACFSTETLGSVLTAQPSGLPPIWIQALGKPPSSLAAQHNLARAGTLRRRLGIPNPVAFFALVTAISKNWAVLSGHFAQSKLSRSRPAMGAERALETEIHFSRLVEERARCRRQGRYVLQADVSQFYHSLYTHAIPWALHGKGLSKKNTGDKSLVGNVLDELVRSGQDRQSVGIPIGPDSSLVLAELLMTAVDRVVDEQVVFSGAFRFVDDWEMSFTSLAKAEQGLARLQQILGEWELTLNPKKTHIRELPLGLEAPWAVELGQFEIDRSERRARASLLRFFDLAFKLALAHPDENVIKYALGRLRRQGVVEKNWDILEALMFQSVNAEPGVLNYVLDVVERYARAGCSIDEKGLAALLSDQIVRHAPRGHGSEVLWALWGALRFDLELGSSCAAAVLKIQDPFVAILALDLAKRGKIDFSQASAWWADVMVPEALEDSHWPLSYEAGIKKFLPGGKSHIVKNPYFSFLKTAGVEFYIPVQVFVPPDSSVPVEQVSPTNDSSIGLGDYS